MFKKRIKQIKILIDDVFVFIFLKYLKQEHLKKNVLYVDFKNPNLYHRFFYLLLKFYNVSDYSIVYPMDFHRFRNLRNGDNYLALILKEKDFLVIKNLSKKPNYIVINDGHFSEDYFKNYFTENNQQKNVFHVPFTFHPFMYNNGMWNKKVERKERIKSLFCYGNFDENAYLDIDKIGFKVANRVKIKNSLSNKPNFVSIRNKEHLEKLISERASHQLIFVEKHQYQLPMQDVFERISNFWFHMCCPGVVIPLCHNVVEAISVGTIPVIEKEYAELIYPNLVHMENAIIFEGLDGLNATVENIIFNLGDEKLHEISENVFKYYRENIWPENVVMKINENLDKSIVYLNAEHRSVRQYK